MADEPGFDLKQHDFLRQDIQTAEVEARALERYVLLGVAAMWAWTAKEAPQIGPIIGVISAVLGLLGGLRMWAFWNHISVKGDYVAQIECLCAHEKLGGWERYFRAVQSGAVTIPSSHLIREERRNWLWRPGLIGYTSGIFWLVLILGSVPFGYLVSHTAPKSAPAEPVQVGIVSATVAGALRE